MFRHGWYVTISDHVYPLFLGEVTLRGLFFFRSELFGEERTFPSKNVRADLAGHMQLMNSRPTTIIKTCCRVSTFPRSQGGGRRLGQSGLTFSHHVSRALHQHGTHSRPVVQTLDPYNARASQRPTCWLGCSPVNTMKMFIYYFRRSCERAVGTQIFAHHILTIVSEMKMKTRKLPFWSSFVVLRRMRELGELRPLGMPC